MPRGVERVFILSVPQAQHLVTLGVYATPQAAMDRAAHEDGAMAREVPTIWTWAEDSQDVQHGFAKGQPNNVRWVIEPWRVTQ